MSTTGAPSLASSGPTRTRFPECLDTDGVEAERVRSILRACGKNAGERTPLVIPRVHLQHVAAGLVKPGDDDDLVLDCDPGETLYRRRVNLEPRVGRTSRPWVV